VTKERQNTKNSINNQDNKTLKDREIVTTKEEIRALGSGVYFTWKDRTKALIYYLSFHTWQAVS